MDVSRLKTVLLNSKIQQQNPALYQTISSIIDSILSLSSLTFGSAGSGSSGVTIDEVREVGYWTPLVWANGPGSVELVVTDQNAPIAIWNTE